jgi:hypothetical protein
MQGPDVVNKTLESILKAYLYQNIVALCDLQSEVP